MATLAARLLAVVQAIGADIKALGGRIAPVVTSVNTDFTLASSDVGKYFRSTKASGEHKITVPSNASDPIPVNSLFFLEQGGDAVPTFVPASGVTINSKLPGAAGCAAKYGVIRLRKVAADSWTADGDIGGTSFGRYWRIRTTTTWNGYWGCADIELRETAGGPDITTPSSVISGSDPNAGYPPPNAIDNVDSTFTTTASASGNHSLTIDFGAGVVKKIVEVAIRGRPDGYREDPTAFVVEFSQNNVDWSEAWTVTSTGGGWAAGERRVFTKP